MSDRVPLGWPAALPPGEAEEFPAAALRWLFDLAPPEWRGYPVLRKHPVVLCRMVREHLQAAALAAEQGLRSARAGLSGALSAVALDEVVAVYEREAARLVAAARAAGLVERALARAAGGRAAT
ncbi:MAG: hypothetical protein ACYDAQ_07980 [Mycobacteriales bacterium]